MERVQHVRARRQDATGRRGRYSPERSRRGAGGATGRKNTSSPVAPSRLPFARAVRASVASLGEERQIAFLRLPFALPPLLVFQGSLGPTTHPGLTAVTAAVYALYSLFAALCASRAANAPDTRLARRFAFWAPLTLVIDLALTSLLVYAIGAPATPAALQYLYALFAAAVRWGPRGAAAAALLGGLLAVGALLPSAGARGAEGAFWGTVPASRQALRPIGFANLYLLGAALLGSRFCGIFGRRSEQAVAAERDRIARDLHDDFVQTLVAAGLRVEFCRTLLGDGTDAGCPPPATLPEELDSLHTMLALSLKDAREYLVGMRPAMRRGLTLAACLERCATEIFRGQPVETRVSVTPPNPSLAPEVETSAFYIAREALFNARKHAAPRHVMVTLECRHEIVTVTVTDDGRGMSPEIADEQGMLLSLVGHGLRNMRERAAAIGGTLRVVTTPGEGTCVNAELPFQPRRIRPLREA
jgi:signal transduction histidine kinase